MYKNIYVFLEKGKIMSDTEGTQKLHLHLTFCSLSGVCVAACVCEGWAAVLCSSDAGSEQQCSFKADPTVDEKKNRH